MERGAFQATVHGVAKSWTQLSARTYIQSCENKPVSFSDEANFINVSLLTYIPAETGWKADIWDLGPFGAGLHLGKSLLEQQNMKKL